MGWTKSGKTETLLSFANHGAQYIGDEWIVLSDDGQVMYGIPNRITLWDWHSRYVPDLMPKISTQKKIVFKGVYFLDAINRLFENSRFKDTFPLDIIKQAMPALKRQLKVVGGPKQIFGDQICDQGITPSTLFLMMSRSDPDISIEPCQPQEIVQRMQHSNETEQLYFFEYYKAFRFAFPHLRNEFLEGVNELQSSLLCRALGDKEAYKVLHPYPVSFEALFDQMQPFCRKTEKMKKPAVVQAAGC